MLASCTVPRNELKFIQMCIFVMSGPHIENGYTKWPHLSRRLPTFLHVDRNMPIFWKAVFRFALFINVVKVIFCLEEATKAHKRSRGIAVCTVSLTLAFGGACPPGRDPVPIVQQTSWALGPVWTCAENPARTGIRIPDRPPRTESLYRLRYLGPVMNTGQ